METWCVDVCAVVDRGPITLVVLRVGVRLRRISQARTERSLTRSDPEPRRSYSDSRYIRLMKGPT